MKEIVQILALSFFLLSCEKDKKIDAENPSINYVSFAGFPVTTIKFDKALRTITLQIPAILPDSGLIPAFGLSENAKIVQGLTPKGNLDLSLIDVCKRSDGTNREGEVIVANEAMTATTSYRVVLVPPAGCPVPFARMLNYSFGPYKPDREVIEYHLPLKNAYRNFQIRSLRFTVYRFGVPTVYEPDLTASPCLVYFDGDYPNHLITSFGQNILDKYQFWNEISFTTDCDTNRVRFYRYY